MAPVNMHMEMPIERILSGNKELAERLKSKDIRTLEDLSNTKFKYLMYDDVVLRYWDTFVQIIMMRFVTVKTRSKEY